MYADDLLVLNPITSQDSKRLLQQDSDMIAQTFSDLFLMLNPLKSEVIVFSVTPKAPTIHLTISNSVTYS